MSGNMLRFLVIIIFFSDLNKYRLHTKGEVAKSLGNQARGVQPACTMTTQNSKTRLISSIALKSRLIS